VRSICDAIATLDIAHAASIVAPMLTVSAGGATRIDGSDETAAAMFEAADVQLYRAKKGGRNRVAWRVQEDAAAEPAALAGAGD